MTLTAKLSEINIDKWTDLVGVELPTTGRIIPRMQIRIGRMTGPLVEGTVGEVCEAAGCLVLDAQSGARIVHIGTGKPVEGSLEELTALASQIATIAGEVEYQYSPAEAFTNLGPQNLGASL